VAQKKRGRAANNRIPGFFHRIPSCCGSLLFLTRRCLSILGKESCEPSIDMEDTANTTDDNPGPFMSFCDVFLLLLPVRHLLLLLLTVSVDGRSWLWAHLYQLCLQSTDRHSSVFVFNHPCVRKRTLGLNNRSVFSLELTSPLFSLVMFSRRFAIAR
jgi:hypothetical protein